jgi:hypothetical protein
LNRYFAAIASWSADDITRRGEELAERALRVWPDFGSEEVLPDEGLPDEEPQEDVKLLVARTLEQLGGEAERVGGGRFRHYRLKDGRIVNLKHSKRHTKGYYWFGIHHTLYEDMAKAGATHLVFILGSHGFLIVPLGVVRDYLAHARVSRTSSGTVRHYHVHISAEPEFEFYHHGRAERVPARPYYQAFSS